VAQRLERLETWWDGVERGDVDVVPSLAGTDAAKREEFIRLFRGDTGRRVRDGLIKAIAKGDPAEILAVTEEADRKERDLREDHRSKIEGLVVQDIIVLLLAVHRADLRAMEVEVDCSLGQARYYNDQRRLARRMFHNAVGLLGAVHYRIAQAEAVANPGRNDWNFSTRIGDYRHSRN
jgi:hypothetical protein